LKRKKHYNYSFKDKKRKEVDRMKYKQRLQLYECLKSIAKCYPVDYKTYERLMKSIAEVLKI